MKICTKDMSAVRLVAIHSFAIFHSKITRISILLESYLI